MKKTYVYNTGNYSDPKDELEIEKIKKLKKIGIMAGASTPHESIMKIVDIIKKTC